MNATETLDEAHKWMTKIDRFEERQLKLPLEYRVISDMMNLLKNATGKERFVLLQKLNRAVRIMECKEAYDPSNPANFGLIQHQQVGSPEDLTLNAGFDKEKQMIQGQEPEDDEEEEFNEAKERDDLLIEKLNAIEKKIENKLEELDHTFGKKGRVLEEEIKDLVEERNSHSEKKRRPMYRKVSDIVNWKWLFLSGFRLASRILTHMYGHDKLDRALTSKLSTLTGHAKSQRSVCFVSMISTAAYSLILHFASQGGQIAKFTALLATGNYHGVVGFAKAKGPTAKIAIQRVWMVHFSKQASELIYVQFECCIFVW